MHVGERLKMLLLENNLTEYRLAKLSGVSKQTINKITTGRVLNPSVEITQKLAKALNLTLSELTGELATEKSNIIDNLKLLMGNMTSKEFSEYIGCETITEEMIDMYLSGEATPGQGTLDIIADKTGVDIDIFYDNPNKQFGNKDPCNSLDIELNNLIPNIKKLPDEDKKHIINYCRFLINKK